MKIITKCRFSIHLKCLSRSLFIPLHIIVEQLRFKLDKKTYLYSIDSCFAEISLHLNIDLDITNIAEEGEKCHPLKSLLQSVLKG